MQSIEINYPSDVICEFDGCKKPCVCNDAAFCKEHNVCRECGTAKSPTWSLTTRESTYQACVLCFDKIVFHRKMFNAYMETRFKDDAWGDFRDIIWNYNFLDEKMCFYESGISQEFLLKDQPLSKWKWENLIFTAGDKYDALQKILPFLDEKRDLKTCLPLIHFKISFDGKISKVVHNRQIPDDLELAYFSIIKMSEIEEPVLLEQN